MDKISKMKENNKNVEAFLSKYKYHNTCLKGCVDCCRDYFYASQTEFYLSLDKLLSIPANLDYFYKKAQKTYNFFNYYLPSEINRLDPLTSNRLLANIGEDFSFGENINYQNLPDCIMLNSKRCSIYDSRFNTCRLYGTVNICEYLNNKDYSDDEFTNYNLYPLIENTQLVHSDLYKLKTFRYPIWFYFSYFLRPKFRPYVITNLNKMKENSEDDYIEMMV